MNGRVAIQWGGGGAELHSENLKTSMDSWLLLSGSRGWLEPGKTCDERSKLKRRGFCMSVYSRAFAMRRELMR